MYRKNMGKSVSDYHYIVDNRKTKYNIGNVDIIQSQQNDSIKEHFVSLYAIKLSLIPYVTSLEITYMLYTVPVNIITHGFIYRVNIESLSLYGDKLVVNIISCFR